MKNFLKSNTTVFLIASLTLGLAPFAPEPHIWGKIKWIMGGAKGMGAVDWFDFFMHATPFLLLLVSILLRFLNTKATSGDIK